MSTAGSQVLIPFLMNMLDHSLKSIVQSCVQCYCLWSFRTKNQTPNPSCVLVEQAVVSELGRLARGQQKHNCAEFRAFGCAVIDSRDLCHWQIGRRDNVEQRGGLSALDVAHMAKGWRYGVCACKCCHSDDVLRLTLRSDSIKSRWSAPVEENIGFTTMGVKWVMLYTDSGGVMKK